MSDTSFNTKAEKAALKKWQMESFRLFVAGVLRQAVYWQEEGHLEDEDVRDALHALVCEFDARIVNKNRKNTT